MLDLAPSLQVRRAVLFAFLWIPGLFGYLTGGRAIGKTLPWDAAWVLRYDKCEIVDVTNPHDRGFFFAIIAAAAVGTVAALFRRDWTATTSLTVAAALSTYALGLQSLEWQAYRLLNGYDGLTCTASWKSTEFLLRDAAWLASQQTAGLYVAILFGLIFLAGTAESTPRPGRWPRGWRGRSVAKWMAWVLVACVACTLPIAPHALAEEALAEAPAREILLYVPLLTLLALGLLSIFPYARLRAVGVTAVSLAIALAFTQMTFMTTFIADQATTVVSEGATEISVSVESSLTAYQQAALDRVAQFYSVSAAMAVMLLTLAASARLLLGGSLFAASSAVADSAATSGRITSVRVPHTLGDANK